jgi:shikimate dehydrogenase
LTAVYGIFGWPVAHSRSPAMQNAAFAALELDAVYVPYAIAPARLERAVEAVRALGIAGFNVTLPHKAAIMPFLTAIDPAARAIGAVNTVVRDGEQLFGANTDAEGLARALHEANVPLQDSEIVVLGAGGAARAAVVGLAHAGATQIAIAARRAPEAEALVAALASHAGAARLRASGFGADLTDACKRCSLLIQATSATLGASAEARSFADNLPLAALPRSAVVCDLVYKPRQTALLERAQALGFRTVDGLGMLLHQGALAFERWTGRAAPLSVMRAALEG